MNHRLGYKKPPYIATKCWIVKHRPGQAVTEPPTVWGAWKGGTGPLAARGTWRMRAGRRGQAVTEPPT